MLKGLPERIEEAANRIYSITRRTPLDFSPWFSKETGSKVHFKLESLQYTGSFKLRGVTNKLLAMSVNEIELSVRAANCLNNANITTVGQLAMKTEQEMLKYRNFGKKSLNEIKDKLTSLGLGLGMTFDADLVEPPKPATSAPEV